ncbi:hypothetical protein C5167_016358 [Papaver somniferum]|nr:hypothetical protein C5167_016358 [Papaver somniferum]
MIAKAIRRTSFDGDPDPAVGKLQMVFFIGRLGVTNHTGVLFKKLIWGFELFLHEGDMIPALASAEPKLHPAKDEHRDIFKYYTEGLIHYVTTISAIGGAATNGFFFLEPFPAMIILIR